MAHNIDAIKDKISDMMYNDDGSCYWDDIIEAFTDEEVEAMREYYLNSNIQMTNESAELCSDCIYAFMRLMAIEYIIEDDLGRTDNIIHWFNNF